MSSKKVKRKREVSTDDATQAPKKKTELQAKWELNRYVNKQRTLVFSSRGISHRDRHLLGDLRDLMPHAKKDVKFDAKNKLHLINEVAELKNCNNCVYLENKKRKDLYLWVSKTPHGPSAKFLLQNIHTMSETKMTGNCLKGSRPLLLFDKNFDAQPHYQLMKEMFTQTFGSPKGHPHVKPFIDHILSFFIVDDRIWFRNYQVVFSGNQEGEGKKGKGDMMLVEIGPRMVLNPVRIFSGSFGGPALWENPNYTSPNLIRQQLKTRKSAKYTNKVNAKEMRADHAETHQLSEDELDNVFA